MASSGKDTAVGNSVPKPIEDEDPVVLSFFAFVEQEMANRPESIRPLDAKLLADVDKLVGHIEVDLDEDLGEDTYLP